MEVDDSCYAAVSGDYNWLSANDACKTLHKNAHLAIVSSAEKQTAVEAIFAHLGKPIGLYNIGLLLLFFAYSTIHVAYVCGPGLCLTNVSCFFTDAIIIIILLTPTVVA